MNKYLSFISDEDYKRCVSHVFNTYVNNDDFYLEDLYKNQVDPIKFIMDKSFLNMSDEDLLERERRRQMEKTNTNSIGTFHEEMIGSIKGFTHGIEQGWDVKSNDETIFAELKNKYNTMNSGSSEQVYIKLQKLAEEHPNATCYCVQILAKESFNKPWVMTSHGVEYNHPRVRIISGDQFYYLVTGIPDAFKQIYETLEDVCKEVKSKQSCKQMKLWEDDSLYDQVMRNTDKSLINKITYDNYKQYLGFGKL